MRWLPNILTLARLLSVPLLVSLLVREYFAWAFWLFMAAGLSDALDGWLARRYGTVGKLGAYLDPLADKALLGACYLTLGVLDGLPGWLVVLVVSRDLMILGGALALTCAGLRPRMEPLFVSKFNTLVQLALVALVLARLAMPTWGGLAGAAAPVETAMIWLVAATTLASGLAYVAAGRRGAFRPGKSGPGGDDA